MTTSVLHLVGSAVSAFHSDLSLLYARDCLAATRDEALYDTHLALVSPDGSWRFPTDLGAEAVAAAEPVPAGRAVTHLTGLGVDVVVPQMFCVPGMTSYRALFDVLGIPYVGNAPGVMALTSDKARTKAVVAAAGVRVPDGEVLRRGDRPTTRPPAVVKPGASDNSLGVGLVRSAEEFPAALEAAFAHGPEVVVERYVELGREVRCGVVVRDGRLVCLPLEEYDVDSARKPVRGPEDKLDRDPSGALYLVAKDATRSWVVDVDDPVTGAVWRAARRAHVALGCRDYSLFDFRVDPHGQPWFLEASLYCSFAEKSVIPVMAAAAGTALPELFATALETALRPEPQRLAAHDEEDTPWTPARSSP